jgi:RNA polymerase sigma factor (sigma-70 family)
MGLIYNEDFWEFYKLNQKDIDRLLWSAVWSVASHFKNTIDPEDLKSEVILKLSRSGFLKTFDSTKSQLGTYFTQRAYGYARHAVTAELDSRRLYQPVATTTAVLDPEVSEDESYEPEESYEPQPVQSPSIPVKEQKSARAGNGHKSKKVRELTAREKGLIRKKLFMSVNGMIEPDACVRFKAKYLPKEITIFQITGCIVGFHGEVAKGQLRLSDMKGYEEFIRSHRNLWKTYNSPRYWKMRKDPVLWYGIKNLDESLDLEELMKAIGKRLNETSKRILSYRIEGYTYKDISEKLGVSFQYVVVDCKKSVAVLTKVYKQLQA